MTYRVYTTDKDFLPGSQGFPTEMPERFIGKVIANSKMAAADLAYEQWPDEHGRFRLEAEKKNERS